MSLDEAWLLASHPIAGAFRHGDVSKRWLGRFARRCGNVLSRSDEVGTEVPGPSGRSQRETPPSHDTRFVIAPGCCGLRSANRNICNQCQDDRGLDGQVAPRRAGPTTLAPGAFHRAASGFRARWRRASSSTVGAFCISWGSARQPTLRDSVRERTSALLAPRSNPARLLRLKCRGS